MNYPKYILYIKINTFFYYIYMYGKYPEAKESYDWWTDLLPEVVQFK